MPYGKMQGLHGTLISYEGNSVEEIKEDFEWAIDYYLQSCEERGIEPAKPYSGKLNLRMPSELQAAIAQAAHSTGTTINDFINRSLENKLKIKNNQITICIVTKKWLLLHLNGKEREID